jgi:hypothetical protein
MSIPPFEGRKFRLTGGGHFVTIFKRFLWIWRNRGEMAERFKAPVLKTGDAERHRGFESLSLRHLPYTGLEKYPSGRRGSPAKGVVRDKRSESSNLSFSAKLTLRNQCFSGFLLLILH